MFPKILLALLLSTVLSSCGKIVEEPKKHYSFAVAQTGTVALSEGTVATVRGENVAELSFRVPGRLSSVAVAVGDRVEKGQLLATVDNREADISAAGYAGSAIELGKVEAALNAIGDSSRAIAESREAVSAAEVKTAETGKFLAERDLELALKNLENFQVTLSGTALSNSERILAAEQSLALAENQLKNTEGILVQQESTLRSSALASLAGAFVTARSGRDFIDGIIGLTEENRHKNDAYENYLGARDSSTVARADSSFRAFDASYRETYTWYYANVAGKTDVSLDVANGALDRASKTLVLEREAFHALRGVLEKTTESTNFNATAITVYEQKTDEFLSGLESSILSSDGKGIEGMKSAIASFGKNRELQISSLRDSVTLSKTALSLAKTGKAVSGSDGKYGLDALEVAVKVKRAGVSVAEQTYRKALASAEMAQRETEAKVLEADAQAIGAGAKKREAKTGLALSNERAGYSEIRAPYSGVIVEKYLDVGTAVSPGVPVLRLSDEEKLKVVFFFDTSVTELEVGDSVSFESLKNGKSFTGRVLSVGNADSFSVAKRGVEVSVEKKFASVGDRLRVKVSGAGLEGIVLPESVIVTRYLIPTLFVVENGKVVSKSVKVVARGDGKVLVEGIAIGAKIIADGKERALEGETVE